MMFHSNRWRLQVWYGVILLVVLTGFGLTAYQWERGRLFRNVDDELTRRIGVLSASLGGPGQRPGRIPPGPDGPPPDDDPLGPGPRPRPGQDPDGDFPR